MIATRTSPRRPRSARFAIGITSAALVATGLTAATTLAASPASAAGGTRIIAAGGTANLVANAAGVDGPGAGPEIPPSPRAAEDGGDAGPTPPGPGAAPRAESSSVRPAGALGRLSFGGLTMRQQRLANGGNQFSVEPPDQGLCVGAGSVVESVNDVLRVFDPAGNPRTGVVDLNTFYNYPAQVNRTTGAQGPFVTDPSCYFDRDTQRFFHVVLTLDVNPANGNFLGPNHLDVAVSSSTDPTQAWTIYRVPVQDDGTQGTPDHGCSGKSDGTGHGPCIGDYPHIGADATGFYVTTNEYSLNGPEFKAAQLYAFDKRALAAGSSSVAVTQLDTTGMAGGHPGFTVWPATAPGAQATGKGGTEYFLSSDAAEEASGVTGGTTSNRIWLWSLTNTGSLASATPAVSLTAGSKRVGRYLAPARADQKAGDFPLGQCLGDATTPTAFGIPCFAVIGLPKAVPQVAETPDANDTRMQQVSYADGKVWGALDTAVTVGGKAKAGVEAFVVDPRGDGEAHSGYLAVSGNNVTYPAIGVTARGKAVMALTLLGKDHYPSAAVSTLSDSAEFGSVRVLAEGAGPADGFTAYAVIGGGRSRWGDYGATAVDGNTIWTASEYIGQTCTLAQYASAPFGSCGGTRVTFGNWATRVSQVVP